MSFKPKYLAYLIFPIALTFLFVGTQRNGNMMLFLTAGGFLLSFLIQDKWIKTFYLWSIALGLIGYCFLIGKMDHTFYVLHMSAMDSLVKLSVAMLIYSVASRIQVAEFESVFNVICILILIECFLYILQYFGLNLLIAVSSSLGYEIRPGQGAATLGNINFFAICLAITLPLFFRKRWAWCLLFIIPILISARTAGAALAAAGAVAYWAWKTKGNSRLLTGLAILTIIGTGLTIFFVWFDPKSFALDPFRIGLWNTMLASWHQWALIGNGIGSLPMLLKVEHAHNDFLEAIFEGGIPYFVCITGFVICFLRRSIREHNKNDLIIISGLIALGISSLFHYPLHLAPSGFIALVLLGMYTSGGRNGRLLNLR